MRFDSLSDFRKAAWHRLRDAKELMVRPSLATNESGWDRRHLRGAMYLAGYTVECIVKAYLITMHSPLTTLRDVDAKLRSFDPSTPDLLSAAGHSVSVLVRYTDLDTCFSPSQMKAISVLSSTWNSNMRYDPSQPLRVHATTVVNHASDIYDWVNARI